MKKIINTLNAPKAVGPYSQAILSESTLYVSGQLPIDLSTGVPMDGIEVQTKQSLTYIEAICKEAGFKKEDIVKCCVFMKNMSEFSLMNKVYSDFFDKHTPARVTVEVARLPKDVLVEIDAIATK